MFTFGRECVSESSVSWKTPMLDVTPREESDARTGNGLGIESWISPLSYTHVLTKAHFESSEVFPIQYLQLLLWQSCQADFAFVMFSDFQHFMRNANGKKKGCNSPYLFPTGQECLVQREAIAHPASSPPVRCLL